MKLISKLRQNKVAVGPFCKSSDPAIIECIGLAGFDFAIIDLEHGPGTIEHAQHLVRAAMLHDLTPIIRVSENNETQISKALDIGALGVQIPQINSKIQAEKAVQAAKFAPVGSRGVCRYVRAAGYSSKEKNRYFQESNRNTLVIVHIEGKEGMRHIDEILDVEGIDVIFLGPYDLSQSLGVPGEVTHPIVISAMKDMVEKSKLKNKIVGTFVESPEDVRVWAELGVLYLSYKVDVGIFYDACQNTSKQINKVIDA